MTHPVPLLEHGCWSEMLLARADLLAAKPSSVPWEDAAAFPVPALTADQAIGFALGSSGARRLLVHGAGGVTGQPRRRLARPGPRLGGWRRRGRSDQCGPWR